jgi:hypothetical protein
MPVTLPDGLAQDLARDATRYHALRRAAYVTLDEDGAQ